jgi:hypothetical protein
MHGIYPRAQGLDQVHVHVDYFSGKFQALAITGRSMDNAADSDTARYILEMGMAQDPF